MADDLDQKIQDVYKRIQTERKVLDASQMLRQATTNPIVLKQNEAQIRDAERNISYFEKALRELQEHKLSQVSPKPKTYTNLDLIKADTPLTTAKISKMLHQLEFKLQVEMQYKKGIDKMAKLYQADGDKKSRADAESKRVESERKIQLLQSALKRYKALHIYDDMEEEEQPSAATTMPGVEGERKENLRSKPLSGKLQITLIGARELNHIPMPIGRSRSSSKAVDTYVSFKVEGTQRERSAASRTDRWMEDHEIVVDKANEVEVAIFDKSYGEAYPTPIGFLWIKINDLVEAQRRQRVVNESGQGGWVTAHAMNGAAPAGYMMGQPGGHDDMNAPVTFSGGVNPSAPSMPPSSEGIDAWFTVEPAGAIALRLNFVKENVRKRPLDAQGGLARQAALRKRKEEVHEMNGHKFVQRQFYQLILCAFCNEFLLNAAGYQCEDCRYTCHKKCYEKVVTKCISKSNTGEDDGEKINHRIPHRFEPITNMGANWCCHCGYMLPLGRKNARKCSECNITCHANCAHLVPDFCGMSMETANQLLRAWGDIDKARGARTSQAPRPSPQPPSNQYQTPPHHGQQEDLSQSMNRMRLGSMDSVSSPVASEYSYGRPVQPQPSLQIPESRRSQQLPSIPSAQASPVQSVRPLPGGKQPFPTGPVPRPAQPGYEPTLQNQLTHSPAAAPLHPSGSPRIPPPTAERQPTLPASVAPPSPQVQVQQSQRPPAARKRKVGLDDFNFLAVLGKGNFGKVMLAEEKKTNSLYAIKVLKKEFIIDNDEVESTRSEKRVFLAAARERHPFLLGLHSCFQTETRVYFVMEYVSGGDLMLHIQRKQFSLRQAKFYASEVLLALEYFHANGIIYRDLKLDNILLTLDGHVKVADYGLCKEEMWFGSTTSTFCGTPEFMAPEILLEQRYGRAVDWWAFGVLMYEMLLGQSPFRGDDEDEIFDAILEDEPLYPITMPRDAVSILQKLLTRDPTRRLGSGKTDAEEIKRHPFFKDVSFDDVINKRIPPPYCPTINGSADTSNFDEEFTREQPTLTPVHGQLSSRDQAEFNGFSWVAAWADI